MRNFLRSLRDDNTLPSSGMVLREFQAFQRAQRGICKNMDAELKALTYHDLHSMIVEWLKVNASRV